MGFNLGEIRAAFEVGSNTSLSALRKMFMKKIQLLQDEEKNPASSPYLGARLS